jgi:hypothetical protein
MAKTLSSVALVAPSGNIEINNRTSFDMTIDPTFSGSGVVTAYTLTWEWDQGTATWATIGTSSSAGLYHAGTNPQSGLTTEADTTLAITAGVPGTYNIRGKGNTYYTEERQVIVDALAYSLTCDAGSFTETGQAVSLLAARKITAEYGSYALSGQDVTFKRGEVLTCEYGAFTHSGQDATLTYAGSGAYSLTCEVGSFALSGQDATLKAARKITCTMRMYNTITNSLEAVIVPLAPIACFPGGETSGTVAKNIGSLGLAADGTISGVTLNAIDGPAGTRAWSLDGVNDYAYLEAAPLTALNTALNKDVHTILIWSKIHTIDTSRDTMFQLYTDANNYELSQKANATLYETNRYANTEVDTRYVGVSDTGWHLFAIAVDADANVTKVYYDAVQQGANLTTNNAWVGDLVGFVIGRLAVAGSYYWYGYLSHAAIFSTVLALEQNQAIYAAGQAAAWTSLTVQRKITAEQASYALSGQDISTSVARAVLATSGVFSLSGQDASLLAARKITAEAGSYALSGQDCTLTYTPGAGDYTLVCDYAAFTLTGQDCTLRAARVLSAVYAAYAMTGQDVTLKAARLMAAVYGSFALSGQDAGVDAGRLISAGAGSYALSGQTVALVRALVLAAGYGLYSLSGQDVTLDYSAKRMPHTATAGSGTAYGVSGSTRGNSVAGTSTRFGVTGGTEKHG